ncbi:MAG: ATP-binding cassette domain-containing protein [Clostridia bacterium]|nr:ATP-binding cassette domain-containing protein [Clostridia bacterium]
MTRNPIVTFENVRFCYDEVCAVSDLNFTIYEKSLTAVVGPNGGGKSTLLKLLSGLIKPDKGLINVNDSHAIAYVSQFVDFDTSFPITVLEMVLTGTLCKKVKPFCKYTRDQRERALNSIARVSLDGYEGRGINQLSGGELKRAIIARALASDADIIVLDEADGNLDVDAARELYGILEGLKSDKTILVASHHLNDILDIADSAIYVRRTATEYASSMDLKQKLGGRIIL